MLTENRNILFARSTTATIDIELNNDHIQTVLLHFQTKGCQNIVVFCHKGLSRTINYKAVFNYLTIDRLKNVFLTTLGMEGPVEIQVHDVDH